MKDSVDGALVIDKAEGILSREINAWHGLVRKFGRTIDFNADVGAIGQYGFHYLVWLRPLVEACVLTGEDRYAADFVEIMRQYYRQRDRLTRRIPNLHPVYTNWARTRRSGCYYLPTPG